eukprot:CAMPEP_0119152912 /NCGR_PEP_ID=MMETSP1310-20130426/48470_1 /TAXON_ID=464262 /ORGANISM="Genus nov. species nov., Strain RCC2339" /LENGTH=268 /DNA_ID=CAMNT_0007145323 /DNA_START=60 /DNA_END=863 /DNA_ORIENTATION=-
MGDVFADTMGGAIRGVWAAGGGSRGPLECVEGQEGLSVCLGVPYAVPPVGDMRWKPPVAHPDWDEVRDATEYGPNCLQVSQPNLVNVSYDPLSEDCLFLNFWAPAVVSQASLPVLVFVHGGGFYLGGSSDATLNGTLLASRGAVVVTLNYRLGSLGFLALEELKAEPGSGGSTGNYGIMDQQEALRWVRRNVGALGGDPARVLLFGQSAGANSMFVHVASPLSEGLFSRVGAMSGYPRGVYTLAGAEQVGGAIVGRTPCGDAPSGQLL